MNHSQMNNQIHSHYMPFAFNNISMCPMCLNYPYVPYCAYMAIVSLCVLCV